MTVPRRRWLRPRRILFAAVALVVLKLFVPSLERRMVFFPLTGEDTNPGALGIRYQPVTLTTSDNERLVLWQLEPAAPIADVVYFHGNGGNLSGWLPIFAAMHRLDIRVLAVDYRGYGRSTGVPSQDGLLRDADAVARYAHEHRTAGRPLVYWGRSLGGTIAAAATRVQKPDGVILESTFPEKVAVIRRQPILRALNLFSRRDFPTVDWLRGFDRPVLVMHGDRDSIIPYRLGQELFARLESPKTFVTLPGADHNDFVDLSNREYWNAVLAFIRGLPSG